MCTYGSNTFENECVMEARWWWWWGWEPKLSSPSCSCLMKGRHPSHHNTKTSISPLSFLVCFIVWEYCSIISELIFYCLLLLFFFFWLLSTPTGAPLSCYVPPITLHGPPHAMPHFQFHISESLIRMIWTDHHKSKISTLDVGIFFSSVVNQNSTSTRDFPCVKGY